MVVRRWKRWIVKAKSGTSLERVRRRRIGITLSTCVRIMGVMRGGSAGWGRWWDVRNETRKDPDYPYDPALCNITSHRPPVEDQVEGEVLAEDEGGEGDEDDGCGVVGELEEEDGADYAERWEIGERTWTRGFPSPWRHRFLL